MRNRSNWLVVREYLLFRKEVDQISQSSLLIEESRFRHLLEWAGSKSFDQSPMIRPTLPEYILSARRDDPVKELSPVYVRKLIRTAHNFFRWLSNHKEGYSKFINQAWLDTLKAPRMTIEPEEHEAVTLEEINAIANAPTTNLKEKRIQAAAVLLFLSGMRVGAFVSLPLAAINLDHLSIKQWPKLGVKTKFKKHATTYLLNIPELLKVVKEWDDTVRLILPNEGLWFAPMVPETGEINRVVKKIDYDRNSKVRKDLREWMKKVGLAYHSPHKFRHGHAVYGLKNAKDIVAFKAVSQNLMHANLSITDGLYAMLSDNDVKNQIAALGQQNTNYDDLLTDSLIDLLLARIKQKSQQSVNISF